MRIKLTGGTIAYFNKGIVASSDCEIELTDVNAHHFETLIEINDSNKKSDFLARLGLHADTPDEAIRDALNKLYPLRDENINIQEKAITTSKISKYLTDAANVSTIVTALIGFFVEK